MLPTLSINDCSMCPRLTANLHIKQDNVFINTKLASVGAQVVVGDVVKVKRQSIEPHDTDNLELIALNKPVGIIMAKHVRDDITDFINHSRRTFSIWHLDNDSQRLIFLTNDAELVNKFLRIGNNHQKECQLNINKPVASF